MRVPLTTVELFDSQSKPSSVYGQINDANKPQSSGVFDTSPVGSTAPAVGSPMPAFGTSSSPTVGASSSTNVDLSGPSTQPAFGVSSTPALGFSSTPAFGSTISPSVFGSPPRVSFRDTQPAFGVSSTPAVGTPAVSASTTSAFGVSLTPANCAATFPSGFGPSGSSPFAPTSTCFWPLSTPFGGQATTPVCCRCSGFGQSFFEGQRGGSRVYPYSQTPEVPFFEGQRRGSRVYSYSQTPEVPFFEGQRGGSRVYPYSQTPEVSKDDWNFGTPAGILEFGSSSTPAFGASSTPAFGSPSTPAFGASSTPAFGFQHTSAKLESISAMSAYQGKCHEELRWEDYQLGDKGGPTPAGQSSGGTDFNTNIKQGSNPFSYSPAFSQITANPFSSSTSTNPFVPKTSTICNPGYSNSIPSFASPYSPSAPCPFGLSPSIAGPTPGFNTNNKQESKPFSYPSTFNQISANPFSSTASSNPFVPKTSSLCTSTSISSPFSSSAPSPTQSVAGSIPGFEAPFGGLTPSPFRSTPVLSPSIIGLVPGVNFGNTQPATLFQSTTPSLGQTSSPFGQNNSDFGQSSASGTNMFSSNPSLQSTSSFGVNHTTSSLSAPFQSAQPTQNPGGFGSLQPAGGQATTPAFGSPGFGQLSGQRVGSRVIPYARTPEPDSGTSGTAAGKLESISAMPAYNEKSHEELRWEDYQSGDKGGAIPAGQSSGGTDFNTNIKPEVNPFSYPPAFSQITANPFSSSTSTNPFVPKTSNICNLGYSNSTPSFASPYSPSAPRPFGPSPSIVGLTPGFNTNNKQESKPFSYPPAFNQISANPFSSTTPSNPFSPKMSTFCTSTLFSSPFSSSAPSTTQSVVGSIPGFGAPFNSTASLVSPFGVLAPTPFGSTPVPSPCIFGLVPGVNFGNTQPATLFQSTTPSLGQTSSPFGQTTSGFGQTTSGFGQATPAFGQSNSDFGQSSASGTNMFSSNPSLQSTSSFGVNRTTSSLSAPFQSAQPTQNPGGFGSLQPAGATSNVFGQNNCGQSAEPTQNQGVLVFVPLAAGTSSIFRQNIFGQLSTNQGPSLAQPKSNINPFETPGAMHRQLAVWEPHL